jgi:hypothetical protein
MFYINITLVVRLICFYNKKPDQLRPGLNAKTKWKLAKANMVNFVVLF